MSSFREAHTPKNLEAELKKCDGSLESTIDMYEKQANQALKEGNKALYESYMCIVNDLKALRSKSVGKANDKPKNALKQKAEKTS